MEGQARLGPRVMLASLLVAGVAAALLLAWHVAPVLLLVFGGVLLAVLLRGLADLLVRYARLGERLALLLVVIGLLLLTLIALSAIAPPLLEGVQQLTAELPKALQRLRTYLQDRPWAQTLLDWLAGAASGGLPPGTLMGIAGVFSTAVGVVGGALIVFALGIYLAASPSVYLSGLVHMVPTARQARLREWLQALGIGLRWWLIGQFSSMLTVGVLTYAGLSLLGVPAALTLAVLAGLLTFIPFLGPFFSAVPAVLMALVESFTLGLYVVGLYLVVQAAEGYVITPVIQRWAIYMPPAVLLVAQLILGVWLGFLGVLLATPLTLVLLITVQMFYVEDVLHQRVRQVWK